MAVLKGEGRVPILFGTWALPITPNRSGYIARPDVAGEHASVILAHDREGLTPGVKAIARYLARRGYSVMVPDLTRGVEPFMDEFEWTVADLADAVGSARIPGTQWASGSHIALVGLGAGAVAAAIVAVQDDVDVLVLAGAVLDGESISQFGGTLLVLHGAGGDLSADDEVRAAHERTGRGEWILYSGVGTGFLDEGSDGFDEAAAADALGRIVDLLDRCFEGVSAT